MKYKLSQNLKLCLNMILVYRYDAKKYKFIFKILIYQNYIYLFINLKIKLY